MKPRKEDYAWHSREKLRQAEQRLNAQAANLAALESRAQMLIGICVAGIGATAAIVFGGSDWLKKVGAFATGCILLIAGIRLALAITPKSGWGVVGFEPKDLDHFKRSTEHRMLTECAAAYQENIEENRNRLNNLGRSISHSTWKILSSPIIGALIAFNS
jgi:hypothetical protein